MKISLLPTSFGFVGCLVALPATEGFTTTFRKTSSGIFQQREEQNDSLTRFSRRRNQMVLFFEPQEQQQENFDVGRTPTTNKAGKGFDLDTALFCGGLAFDAYVEPPQDSSRWEKGVSNCVLLVASL